MYKLRKDQEGMVSIIVTMIIMVLLGLIVLGFAQLSRREQRQSLDRQLAVQAQYAAESGINQAADYVRSNPTTNWADCDDSEAESFSSVLKDDIQFTCVLVDNSLDSLVYQGSAGDSSVFPIKPELGNLSTINIAWTDDTDISRDYSRCVSDSSLPPAIAWPCDAAMLQVDLVPVSNSYNTGSLVESTVSFFLKPVNGAGPTTIALPVSGDVRSVSCTPDGNPGDCSVSISVPPNVRGYYARIQRHYRAANVVVFSEPDVNLIEAQAEIDVTAKSADVLKRLTARVSINQSNNPSKTTIPNSAIHTGQSLCKRLAIVPGSPGTTRIDDPYNDPACDP
ncbi:pilus assembly PilX N-terminal domain-containing protein [Candidatus Saccharibacteria bacterium]|nr:pilus assembly PilX N-terminal domain-containing protein [Candidatus Saccharibacteria bacterium]